MSLDITHSLAARSLQMMCRSLLTGIVLRLMAVPWAAASLAGCSAMTALQHQTTSAREMLCLTSRADTSGNDVALASAHAHGALVLVFYRGHSCPWRRRQLAELSGELAAFEARGASVVGISVDSEEETRRLAEEFSIGFPLLVDTGLHSLSVHVAN